MVPRAAQLEEQIVDYVVLFEDNEENASKRSEFMKEHLAFLEANAAQISAAGPMKNAKTGSHAGGMWLVNAESFDDAMALVKADPFWPTGLRKSIEILEWTKVYADGARRLNP